MERKRRPEQDPGVEAPVVFEDTSTDEQYMLSVRMGPTLGDFESPQATYAGRLTIYEVATGEAVHREDVPMTEATAHGAPPNDEEIEHWGEIMDKFKSGQLSGEEAA